MNNIFIIDANKDVISINNILIIVIRGTLPKNNNPTINPNGKYNRNLTIDEPKCDDKM